MSKERLLGLIRKAVVEYGELSKRPTATEYIADYLLASGKVIVTPVEVGETVWYFSENPLNLSVQENTIYEATVVRIVTTHLGTSLVIQIRNEYGCTEIPDINYFGKKVFLTREEAEAKLKERENNVKP